MASLSADTLQDAQTMLSLMLKKRADGQRVYSDEEIEQYLPLLFIRFVKVVGWNSTPPPIREYLESFATRIGGSDTESFQAQLNRYYEAHPVNVKLARAFERFFAKKSLDVSLVQAFAAFLNTKKAAELQH